ncbi:radical SAM superfamily enzyme YgiQ (UPF0313 family) [Psychrobacter sp. PL15]|nr:radical SAM superfamily enzyme YgiQ (UPF0313 family) [Psychrobacter sp. PL15]
MMNLALWIKSQDYRADQVQAFYPSLMVTATTMYHTHKYPLHKDPLHNAFLRYHDPKN